MPSDLEAMENPRARSAKLRAARRVSEDAEAWGELADEETEA